MIAHPTPQTLDPLGGLTARYFALVTTVIAAVSAAVILAMWANNVVTPALQVGALVAFVAALLVNVVGVDPRFFPFGAGRHAALHGLMLLACLLDAASRLPGPGQIGGWAPVALTILLVLMGSFRPTLEIALFTSVSAIVIAVIVWLNRAGLDELGTIELMLKHTVPLLAVGAGAAAFSHVLVSRVSAWQAENAVVLATSRNAIRAAEETEVLRRRGELIDYRVGPYLEQILDADSLTPVDIARARGLATTLRTMMVRNATRSWLAELVDELDDPAAIVDSLTAEQRRGISAVVTELRASHDLVDDTVCATLAAGSPASLRISAGLRPDRPVRLRPAAYRAVLRSVFPRARVDVGEERVDITLAL